MSIEAKRSLTCPTCRNTVYPSLNWKGGQEPHYTMQQVVDKMEAAGIGFFEVFGKGDNVMIAHEVLEKLNERMED